MASSSNLSVQKRFKYDVFLSFRGEDTRKNFVDHLYQALKDKGIYTYKDDEKIHKGKRISDDLLESIEDSKLYVIVFSKNYASSSWCLEELVKIMECQKMTEHTAYPVFFDVEPTEIRNINQSGAVGEAFAKHENEEAAGKWREALKDAADLAGWELKNTLDGHEAKFIQKIVHEISLELRSINFGFDEKLELSYISLEDDYKEIFLDIACILKGQTKEDAIRILECCGFHARNGLKVLEQRSLINFSSRYDGKLVLGMHDHIEEMGKNIVRRSHPDEPNKHCRLWINEEIEDILANDKGTEATRCLTLDMLGGNSRILMKGLGQMKKLRYLEVIFAKFDSKTNRNARIVMKSLGKMKILRYLILKVLGKIEQKSQYFPNSLIYLICWNYPFLCLPKTFQASNLVGLEMKRSRMVQLWEEGEEKVLKKLKFLSLDNSNLMTFDFGMTPNLEKLSLKYSDNLVELCMPVSCQKLKHLDISYSKLRTFDLGLTPNLETLSLKKCAHFEEVHVSVACPNLKILDLQGSRLRSLDLELIPNLEKLDLAHCDELVEIKAPAGCLRKLVNLNLDSCLRFISFKFYGRCEPKANCSSSATLHLAGESLDLCPLHPNSNLPKFRFRCYYHEYGPSSVGNIEKLISFGLCACTDFKKFSDIICSLQYLQELTLTGDIPEFPKDLGQLKCLEKLCLASTKIKHLPDSICMLERLKSLKVNWYLYTEYLLEKLPEDLGKLECLEKLHVNSEKIEYLPDSICMLKRLKSLDVTCCSCLGKLPEDIGHLESLERLDLSSTKIKHLPDSICMLKHLKYLKLRRCALLEKLPEDLGRLECLEDLDIIDTGISHLPQSIFGLKGLYIYARPELLELYDFPSEIKTKAC